MRTLSFLALVAVTVAAPAQTNISLLGHLDYHALRNSDLSNIWGYAAGGHEYALVGVNGSGGETGGLSVVDVTDPAHPQEVFFRASATSIWREIKVWNDHAYVTTEADAGLLIVDLSPLPESTDLPSTVFMGNNWIRSHSLFIDENGRLYLNGANRGNGGCIFYDLTQDPMAPVEVGVYDTWYVHDCYARNNILYAAHIHNGFFTIVDVSDPSAPVLLGSQNTPNTFSHNCWLDDSGDHLFTTDERSNAYVASYDISDPTDIQEVDRLQSDPGSLTIPHNTYWLNDYLVTSYYTYGVTIYDASRPDNLVEVGHYDTSPLSGDGFNGAWGVYPFLPSGNLLISDIERGLFVLAPTYQRACWLEGTITAAGSGDPIFNATATLAPTLAQDQSAANGSYGLGALTPGTYTLTVHATGYADATVSGLVLASGAVTFQDVQLQPLETTALTLHVREAVTDAPVPGARVHLRSDDLSYDLTTDAQGDVTIGPVFIGAYSATVARWGWKGVCEHPVSVAASTTDVDITLEPGYADDFYFDLGWTVENFSTTGHWVREAPVGTAFNGDPVAPGDEAGDDCGGAAYVTGNGGGSAGTDDVDLGHTVLTSPLFDATTAPDLFLKYDRWFYDSFSTNPANDTLTIELDNGTTVVPVEQVSMESGPMGQWVHRAVRIADVLPPTNTMRLIVTVADLPEENLVEAALDHFRIAPELEAGVNEHMVMDAARIVPNPSRGGFEVRGPWDRASVEVLDLQGRPVVPVRTLRGGVLWIGDDLAPAVYFVRVTDASGRAEVQRAVIE